MRDMLIDFSCTEKLIVFVTMLVFGLQQTMAVLLDIAFTCNIRGTIGRRGVFQDSGLSGQMSIADRRFWGRSGTISTFSIYICCGERAMHHRYTRDVRCDR